MYPTRNCTQECLKRAQRRQKLKGTLFVIFVKYLYIKANKEWEKERVRGQTGKGYKYRSVAATAVDTSADRFAIVGCHVAIELRSSSSLSLSPFRSFMLRNGRISREGPVTYVCVCVCALAGLSLTRSSEIPILGSGAKAFKNGGDQRAGLSRQKSGAGAPTEFGCSLSACIGTVRSALCPLWRRLNGTCKSTKN